MTDTAIALTYVDPARNLYATARSGFALIFDDGKASSHDEAVPIEPTSDGWNAQLPGGLELALKRAAGPVELSGMRAHLCTGADGGLGVMAEIHDPPRWQELDATRYI